MKFKITGRTLVNELRNYAALAFQFFAVILSIPSAICETISKWLKVDE